MSKTRSIYDNVIVRPVSLVLDLDNQIFEMAHLLNAKRIIW